MMALAGRPLGCTFAFLDPSLDACAAPLGELVHAEFDDAAAAAAVAARADVVTFDFENVPAAAARAAAAATPFQPPVAALQRCQDRLDEKRLLHELGIPVPAYHVVDCRASLLEAIDRLGLPCVLKTRRLGYDGKGQAVLRSQGDLEPAWHQLGGQALIAEAFVEFDAECSLLAVRGADGARRFWPLTRNLHDGGVLVLSRPGGFSGELQARAEEYVTRLLEHFDYVGVIAVEFFLERGSLSVNEIAPRVHNSGHWTIEGAVTSQFENHVRAICGLPLGDAAQDRLAVMFNWIGELPERARLLEVPGLHWHDYGKAARPGRKLGHATVTASDAALLNARCEHVVALAGGSWPARWARFQAGVPG